jgi:hypothetical protein
LIRSSNTGLLILDFQDGIGDQSFAKEATVRATQAIDAARPVGIGVIFSKIAFKAGYPEVSQTNQFFESIAEKKLFGR